jgi:hypothetical protein
MRYRITAALLSALLLASCEHRPIDPSVYLPNGKLVDPRDVK